MDGGRFTLDHIVRGENLNSAQEDVRITQCDSVYMVRQPRSSYEAYPSLSLEVATPEKKSRNSTLSSVCRKIGTRSRVRLTSGS